MKAEGTMSSALDSHVLSDKAGNTQYLPERTT